MGVHEQNRINSELAEVQMGRACMTLDQVSAIQGAPCTASAAWELRK